MVPRLEIGKRYFAVGSITRYVANEQMDDSNSVENRIVLYLKCELDKLKTATNVTASSIARVLRTSDANKNKVLIKKVKFSIMNILKRQYDLQSCIMFDPCKAIGPYVKTGRVCRMSIKMYAKETQNECKRADRCASCR